MQAVEYRRIIMPHVIAAIFTGAFAILGYGSFFTAKMAIDNDTTVPLFALFGVLIFIGGAVWKIGRYAKGVEDRLDRIERKLKLTPMGKKGDDLDL